MLTEEKITLRPATREDEPFVNELTRTTMKAYVEATWATQSEREHYYEINSFNQHNTRIIYLADRRVGRVSLKYRDGELFIDNMHVIPEMQSRGIGLQVLQIVINESKQQNLDCSVTVLKCNPAKRLYERAGFEVCGEVNHRFRMKFRHHPMQPESSPTPSPDQKLESR